MTTLNTISTNNTSVAIRHEHHANLINALAVIIWCYRQFADILQFHLPVLIIYSLYSILYTIYSIIYSLFSDYQLLAP
jgi:hypothetical protein